MYKSVFEKIAENKETPSIDILNELVDIIRSQKSAYEGISSPVESLIYFLKLHNNQAVDFKVYIINFINQYKHVDVFSHTGLISGRNFFTALKERIGEHFIPSIADKVQLSYILTQVFDSEEDVQWLKSITPKQWLRLFESFKKIRLDDDDVIDKLKQIQRKILHAIELVSYQVSGLSLNDEVNKAFPEIIELNSPFIAQNQEVINYIKQYEDYLQDVNNDMKAPGEDHVLVMIEQCHDLIKRIHKNTKYSGVSIHLTNILVRLEQKLERLQQLLFLLHPEDAEKSKALGELMYTITYHHHHRSSIRSLISINTEMLSLKITENASKSGKAYVGKGFKDYKNMFLSAAGAGALIGLMATIKILLSDFNLAPIGRAIVHSLNYGLGFVLIYLFHFKIATKQPAMTASSLAASLDKPVNGKRAKLTELSQLIVDILRTQFVAILGNIALAMPIAFACSYLWANYLNDPLLTLNKAKELLHGIDPISSLSLLYAAITGVCLFLSGIISGYYNNLAVYRNLGKRVENHALITKFFSETRAEKIGVYIEGNMGSIAGNFWFGVMLGSMATIGYIIGLPLDIRHIAFSSANFIQGVFWADGSVSVTYIVYLFLGVLLIGLINLLVSFCLTLIVALKARKVRFSQWKELLSLVAFRFFTRPHEFFIPVRQK